MQKNISPSSDKYTITRFFEEWVCENIHRPIKGFEHKKNMDGSFFTPAQQLSATRLQILAVVSYFLNRGKSPDEIRQVVQVFQ